MEGQSQNNKLERISKVLTEQERAAYNGNIELTAELDKELSTLIN